MASQPLVVERVYQAPADKIWKALTNEADMRKWYFNVSGFRPEVGYEFEFTGYDLDNNAMKHLCRVTKVDPGKLIQHTWKYENYPGNSVVTWELFEEGDKTRVRLTHEGLETFPQDIPSFAVTSFTQGWNEILGNMLRKYVNG